MGTQLTKSHTYTIKETATLTGLPESTLRYYESIGIIEPIARDISSKHRMYNEENLEVLDAIACLNATGLSISDMREYFKNRSRGAEAADEQVSLLEQHAIRLRNEAQLLKIRQKYVNLKIAYWRAVKAHSDTEAKAIAEQAKKLVQDLKRLSGKAAR